MYFCMKNSPTNEEDFRESLLTVIDQEEELKEESKALLTLK